MKKSIRSRMLSMLAACAMLAGAAQAVVPAAGFAAENLISNSTFDTGTTDWGIYKESGGAAKLSTEDGKLAMKITDRGTKNYAVQLFYDIIPLYQNATYKFSYEISCDKERYVEAMIQQNGGTYQSYTWKGIEIGPEPVKVDYQFTMTKDTDIMAKLCINCGVEERDADRDLGEHTVYLDNVVLELVNDDEVDYSTVGPYQAPILANQIGYRTNDKKTAVVREDGGNEFKVVNAENDEVVYTGTLGEAAENKSAKENDRIADFSEVKTPGKYYITCGDLDKSYTFVIADDPYKELMKETVRMFYLQRCGCEIEDETFGHKACHTDEATIYGTSDKIDVTGGWHDAGDYGRYTVAAAKAVADLLYAYDANPSLFTDDIGIPESGNGIPDILDEVRYELEWMLKIQAADGGVYHKVSCANFPAYVMPEKEVAELIVMPVSSTATADFVASMAMAYEFYKGVDEAFAQKCLAAAEKSWAYLEANPSYKGYTNPRDVVTGEYGDKTDKDERYWAACQMYRATGKGDYISGITEAKTGLDWSTVGDYGNIALTTMKKDEGKAEAALALGQTALASLTKTAGSAESIVNASPYGSPVTEYNWGSNMTIANAGIVLGLEGKKDAANEVLNYLLGKNPLGACFVTGFGTVSPEAPHHRPSMAKNAAQPGMLVGGVNSNLEDSAAKAYCKTNPPAKCWVDNSESYSTNEITIYWNSPLIYLLALTEKQDSAPVDPPQVTVKGDMDESGKLDVSDAVLLARFLVADKEAVVTAQGRANADCNADGKADEEDLTMMLKAIAKQIVL
ncbi:MAG: glycoside hydrolase family 9 protein [Oscillospiraceae bacterium]|nr:glycoside hydrolase family 9 protein [Oscillospiraceae bacterium]